MSTFTVTVTITLSVSVSNELQNKLELSLPPYLESVAALLCEICTTSLHTWPIQKLCKFIQLH